MSDQAHTPGPWSLNAGEFVISKTGGEICQMNDADGELLDNALANARLIAAAPELLEALEETLEAIALLTPDAPEPVGVSVIGKARGAIAKARIAKP